MKRPLLLGSLFAILIAKSTVQRVNTTEQSPLWVPLSVKSCPNGNTCAGRCKDYFGTERGVTPPTCHCDPYCTELKDCCADYIDKCLGGNKTRAHVFPAKANENVDPAHWKCYQYINAPGSPGVWMKGSCPQNYTNNNSTRAKCEEAGNRAVTSSLTTDLLSSIPTVYCHGNHGEDCVTYRNLYCAQCNGVKWPSFWKIIWKCDFKPPTHYNEGERLRFLVNYCKDFRIKPREENPFRRYCYPVTSKCNHGNYDQKVQAECENGSVGIVYEKKTETDYKNQYCLQCNGHSVNTSLCGPHGMSHDIFNPKSFEILLQFGISPFDPVKVASIKEFPIKPSCDGGGGEIYDGLLEECRNGSLPDPRQSIVDKFRFKLWMQKLSGTNSALSDEAIFKDALVDQLSLSKNGIVHVISLHKEENFTAAVFDVSGARSNGNATLNASKMINRMFEFDEPFELLIANESWTVFKVTHRLLACAKPGIYPPGTFVISGSKVLINNRTSVNASKVQVLTRNRTDLGVAAGSLFVCWSLFAVACERGEALIGLKPRDYTKANNTIVFKAAGTTYNIGEYELQGSTAWVCANYTNATIDKNSGARPHGDLVLWYFTVCGLPLSIISIGFLLATYATFKELHTLPGKNLMGLCVSLALSQFFWLFASGDTDKPLFCHVSAMILHYLFLVSFACMSVIAYDTRRAFPQHQAPITGSTFQSSSRVRLCCYVSFSWALPLVYVALCVLLDNQGVVAIGYGNKFTCWLSDQTGEMVFFGVPVACALFFNLVAFVRTVRAIRSTKKGAKRLTKHTGNQADEVKIYFRLVTLMGFTWFFGLGANLIHPYLRYPFVLLTSLHGIYLAMAFALKPHVFKLYKDKLDSFRLMSRKNTVSFVESNSKTTPTNDVESVL